MSKNSGVKNFKSKLTEEDVIDIITNGLTQKANAEKYNVSQSLISRIRKRKLWRHIKID
jgi:DNA invertase Pin-like site-specific DNA recombinase